MLILTNCNLLINEGVISTLTRIKFMNNQSTKIQRSAILIKCFMVLVMLILAIEIYETNVIDFGSVAGAIGILSMLRGFLCSPSLLSMPIKSWLASSHKISKESRFYFMLALILIVVSGF